MDAGNKRKADDAAGNSEKRAKVSARHFTQPDRRIGFQTEEEEATMPYHTSRLRL